MFLPLIKKPWNKGKIYRQNFHSGRTERKRQEEKECERRPSISVRPRRKVFGFQRGKIFAEKSPARVKTSAARSDFVQERQL